MGHRHTFGTSQMFEIDSDQSWNYTEQPYVHLGTESLTKFLVILYSYFYGVIGFISGQAISSTKEQNYWTKLLPQWGRGGSVTCKFQKF